MTVVQVIAVPSVWNTFSQVQRVGRSTEVGNIDGGIFKEGTVQPTMLGATVVLVE